MSGAPSSWTVGATNYTKVAQDNVEYAVPQGKTVEDRDFIFIIRKDPKTEHFFYVQATTRSKVWELPDQFAPGATPLVPQRALRDRVLAMYEHYNPDGVGKVDVVIKKYGEENGEALIADLVKKYGPEPPAPKAKVGKDNRPLRDRVVAMYRKYNPDGMSKVDVVIQKYGEENGEALIADLVKKYGPEPSADQAADAETASAPSQAPAGAAASPKQAGAPQRSYRDRVLAIYLKQKPNREKAEKATDKAMAKYVGQEDALIQTLVGQFGPEPEPEAVPAAEQPVAAAPGTQEEAKKTPPAAQSEANSGEAPVPFAGNENAAAPAAEAEAAPKKKKKVKVVTERSYHDRVLAIYLKQKPNKEKAEKATDKAMAKYVGQEEALIQTLVGQFGPEPEPEEEAVDEADSGAAPESPTGTETETQSAASEAQSQPPEAAVGDKPPTPEKAATPEQSSEKSSVAPASTSASEPAAASATPEKEKKSASSFDFGDKESNAALLAAARAEVAKHGGNQEQLLVTFIQDRDNRLMAAHSRTEQVTQTLDELRAQTALLQKQLHEAKAQAELELAGMKSHATKIQEETEFAKQSWELEREKLKAQADVSALVAQKTVQGEKVQFEEDRSQFQQTKAKLEETLASLQAEIHQKENQASKMLELLDTKDKDVRGLNEELAALKAENKPVFTLHACTQTQKEDIPTPERSPHAPQTMDEAEQQVSNIVDRELHPTQEGINNSPSPAPAGGPSSASPLRLNLAPAVQQAQQEDEDAALFAEYEALMGQTRNRKDELEDWKKRAKYLEKEVQRLRNVSLLNQSSGQAEKNDEAAKKMKVIMQLRTNIKTLEKKVVDLEMQLMAIPEDKNPAATGTADGMTAQELLNEKHSLESQVNTLQKELSETKAVAKNQRKEIADLRGLLSIHRSTPAGGLRAVLGADKKKPVAAAGTTPDANSNKKKTTAGTMGSAKRGL